MRFFMLLICVAISKSEDTSQTRVHMGNSINLDLNSGKAIEIISLGQYSNSEQPLIIRSRIPDSLRRPEANLNYAVQSTEQESGRIITDGFGLQTPPSFSIPLSGYDTQRTQPYTPNIFFYDDVKSLTEFTGLLNSENSFGMFAVSIPEIAQPDIQPHFFTQQKSIETGGSVISSEIKAANNNYFTQNNENRQKSKSINTVRDNGYIIEKVPFITSFSENGPFLQDDIPSISEIENIFNKPTQNQNFKTINQDVTTRPNFDSANTETHNTINLQKSIIRNNKITQNTNSVDANSLHLDSNILPTMTIINKVNLPINIPEKYTESGNSTAESNSLILTNTETHTVNLKESIEPNNKLNQFTNSMEANILTTEAIINKVSLPQIIPEKNTGSEGSIVESNSLILSNVDKLILPTEEKQIEFKKVDNFNNDTSYTKNNINITYNLLSKGKSIETTTLITLATEEIPALSTDATVKTKLFVSNTEATLVDTTEIFNTANAANMDYTENIGTEDPIA